jgi:alkaline phosphatase
VYNDETLKPSLVELVRTAIASLSRDPNGYVLFVEGNFKQTTI